MQDERWTRDGRKMDGRWVEAGWERNKRWKEDGWSVRLHVTTCTLHVPGKSRRLLFVAAVIIT